MNHISFDEDARAEFLDAVAYYESCESGLGARFKDAVSTEAGAILEMPFRFRSLHGRFRRCLVPGFPYGIIFTIEPDFIFVVAIAHAKRKPGYWKKRGKA
jgi:hypothetical protein